MNDRLVILVVVDNDDLVASTARLLESAGHAAVPAYSVREAVDLLDEVERIDLVLSDIRMLDSTVSICYVFCGIDSRPYL